MRIPARTLYPSSEPRGGGGMCIASGTPPSGCDCAAISGGCSPSEGGDEGSSMLPPPNTLRGPPTAPGADVEERSALEDPPPAAGAPGALARAARARRPSSLMICAPWHSLTHAAMKSCRPHAVCAHGHTKLLTHAKAKAVSTLLPSSLLKRIALLHSLCTPSWWP